jgi:hypothetical protein
VSGELAVYTFAPGSAVPRWVLDRIARFRGSNGRLPSSWGEIGIIEDERAVGDLEEPLDEVRLAGQLGDVVRLFNANHDARGRFASTPGGGGGGGGGGGAASSGHHGGAASSSGGGGGSSASQHTDRARRVALERHPHDPSQMSHEEHAALIAKKTKQIEAGFKAKEAKEANRRARGEVDEAAEKAKRAGEKAKKAAGEHEEAKAGEKSAEALAAERKERQRQAGFKAAEAKRANLAAKKEAEGHAAREKAAREEEHAAKEQAEDAAAHVQHVAGLKRGVDAAAGRLDAARKAVAKLEDKNQQATPKHEAAKAAVEKAEYEHRAAQDAHADAAGRPPGERNRPPMVAHAEQRMAAAHQQVLDAFDAHARAREAWMALHAKQRAAASKYGYGSKQQLKAAEKADEARDPMWKAESAVETAKTRAEEARRNLRVTHQAHEARTLDERKAASRTAEAVLAAQQLLVKSASDEYMAARKKRDDHMAANPKDDRWDPGSKAHALDQEAIRKSKAWDVQLERRRDAELEHEVRRDAMKDLQMKNHDIDALRAKPNKTPLQQQFLAAIGDGLRDEAHAREVGSLLHQEAIARAEADPRISERTAAMGRINQVYKDLRAMKDAQRQALGLSHDADDPPPTPEIEAARAKIAAHWKEIDAMPSREALYGEHARRVLGEVRPMGRPEAGKPAFPMEAEPNLYWHGKGQNPADAATFPKEQARAEHKMVGRLLDSVSENFPTAWIKRSAEGRPMTGQIVPRGFHIGNVVAVSRPSGFDKMGDAEKEKALAKHGSRVATHELGHHMEDVLAGAEHGRPDAGRLVTQFLERRRAGEASKHLGDGYESDEIAFYDKFENPYVGKDYGRRTNRDGTPGNYRASEVMSMGMDGVFHSGSHVWDDKDYAHFTLGVIAGL